MIIPATECHNFALMKPGELQITGVAPSLGVPGGELSITCHGFKPGLPSSAQVMLGEETVQIMSASEDRIIVRIPDNPRALGLTLVCEGFTSPVFPLSIASRLAIGLHPVMNPAIAPDGAVITTISGSRGQQVEHPLVRVSREGEKQSFACEIMNPTGVAFGPDSQLYISSRHDGAVYRCRDYEHLELVAEDLGVACGIAFDSSGALYVGDRAGKIYRIHASGGRAEFAQLEPSVSAYHLAMDSQDRLYVTGPTLSMRDCLYRISPHGDVEVLLRGLARPQGMAFLAGGDLLLAAAWQGNKGIFRFSPDTCTLSYYIAGPMLVGIAVAGDDIFLVDSSALFCLRPGGASLQIA